MCVAQELVKKVLEALIRDAIPLAGTVNAGQATRTFTPLNAFCGNLEHHLPALAVFLRGSVDKPGTAIDISKTYHNTVNSYPIFKKAIVTVAHEAGMKVVGKPAKDKMLSFSGAGEFWTKHLKADYDKQQHDKGEAERLSKVANELKEAVDPSRPETEVAFRQAEEKAALAKAAVDLADPIISHQEFTHNGNYVLGFKVRSSHLHCN